MPFYHKLGNIPRKRHVVYRRESGALYQEELVGTLGFSGMSSLVYHLHAPTQIRQIGDRYPVKPVIAVSNNIQPMKFEGFSVPASDDYIESRRVLFVNNDMAIGLASRLVNRIISSKMPMPTS
jgi:homogentisate 1,2-dioxygenase